MILKKLIALSALACSFAACATAEEKAQPKRLALGEKAPKADVMMEGIDGKRYSIDSSAGQHGTLVLFSCSQCPVVKKWEDRITAIGNEYRKKGFGVIVINSN